MPDSQPRRQNAGAEGFEPRFAGGSEACQADQHVPRRGSRSLGSGGVGPAGSACGRVAVIHVDQIPVLKLTFE